jgi:hypothetical protein
MFRTRMHAPLALIAALLLSAPPAQALDAHQAEGWFSIDGEKVEVRSAYGWQEPHLFDRSKMETIVLVGTQPLDTAALDAYLRIGFEPMAMLQHRGGEGLRLTIDPDGRVVAAAPTRIANASSAVSGSSSGSSVELQPVAGGMAGTARSTEALAIVDLGDDPGAGAHTDRLIAFDLTFRIGLADRTPRGTALPADGGAPGATFLAMHQARLDGDFPAMLALLDSAKAADVEQVLNDPMRAPMMQMMREHGPRSAAIRSGSVDGDLAWLEAGGEMGNGANYRSQVRLVRRAGSWLVAEEHLEMAD